MNRLRSLPPKKMLFAAIAVTLFLLGCSDSLTAPVQTLRRVPHPNGTLISSFNPVTVEITVVDSDGTQYTLNTSAKEVRVSDGSIIALDSSQTEAFATAFQGILETDAIVPPLEDLQMGSGCLLNEPIGDKPPKCQIQTLVSPGQGLANSKQSGVMSSKVATMSPTILWRRDSTYSLPAHTTIPHSAVRFSGPIPMMTYGDVCMDILNIAASNINNYSRNRTLFLRKTMEYGTAAVVTRGTEEIIEHTLPTGSSVAVAVVEMIADQQASRIAVGFLAWEWNTYQCGNQFPVAQVTLGSGYYPGTSPGMLVCNYEHWELSFDGGSTWTGFWVKVCDYAL